MAKAAKTLCDRCESRMAAGDPFCGSCGYPTRWASHEERTAWEVAHYREKSLSAPIKSIADDAPRQRASARVDVLERPKPVRQKKGLGSLFGRRHPEAKTITLPEPKRVEPPVEETAQAPVLTVVRPEPAPAPAPAPARAAATATAAAVAPAPVKKPVAAAPAPKPVAPRPAPRARATKVERPAAPKADGLVSKVERAMDNNEALIDTPATVLAMRMLNQRVRELDEKVQKLERELAAAKATPPSEPEKPRKRFGR